MVRRKRFMYFNRMLFCIYCSVDENGLLFPMRLTNASKNKNGDNLKVFFEKLSRISNHEQKMHANLK